MTNFWDDHMGSDASAANYMTTYGEGPGSETRHLVGSFINDNETVLDVGCGPGHNLDHFMAYGPSVKNYKGIDYSKRFVRVANQRAMAIAGTKTGPFEVGDARKLKEKKNSWDVVILQDIIEHTDGYKKPVEEALRVAKKRVIVTFWRGWIDETKIVDSGDDGWESTYSKEEWEEYLDKLDYFWAEIETKTGANRWHHVYIIDKEEGQ